jgi:dimethylamine monooxygenase subunit A
LVKPEQDISAPWSVLGQPLTLGLRPCTEADWLCLPDPFCAPEHVAARISSDIALRRELFTAHRQKIFQHATVAENAITELVGVIEENLSSYHPALNFKCFESEHQLVSAALNIVDDILLLAPASNATGKRWILKAGFLAFPAHWSLAEKMDRPIEAIHAPVPGLNDRLGNHIGRFFDAMVANAIAKRRNWTIQIDNRLFAPNRHDISGLSQNDMDTRCFVRVEDQRLRKLAGTGWIVFTIRTSLAPIARWRGDMTALTELKNALAGMSDEMQAYRGIKAYRGPLFNWIDEQIALTKLSN